jgi:hypothetical protein
MSTYVARGIFQEDLEVVRAVFFRISVIPVFLLLTVVRPTAYEIMGNPPTKGQWKELLNKVGRHANKEIDKYWKNEWEVEKQRKSSLKYLTIQENHL